MPVLWSFVCTLPPNRCHGVRRIASNAALACVIATTIATTITTSLAPSLGAQVITTTQAPVLPARPKPRGLSEILWDRYGVPHVYGRDEASMYRAFGWAQAEAHGNLLLRLYGESRGRAAEYWGASHRTDDLWLRTNGLTQRAGHAYRQQPPAVRANLDAFVAGINDYARRFPDRIADSVKAVLPISGSDVLAHMQRVLIYEFFAPRAAVLAQTRRNVAAGAQPADAPMRVRDADALGSNAWAVMPRRTVDGNAMLLANPHLPWRDFFTWFEAQLTAPGFEAYGAALVGLPTLAIAFNDSLGWTHTVNTIDGADVYALTLEGNGYRYDGSVRAFQTSTDTLRVKQPDGTIVSEPLVVRMAEQGPVIAERDGRAYALRIAGLDRFKQMEQYQRMASAHNLTDFESGLQQMQLPMFTVMYADAAGHVMHLFNGFVPVRASGDWSAWSGPVRGDTSATMWNSLHTYAELPRVSDPPSGWLQNANDPPWTTTIPFVFRVDAYPSYMAPLAPMAFRPQRSARMLMSDSALTLDSFVRLKHSTRAELADHVLDSLLVIASRGSERVRRASDVLRAWDRTADAESRGGVLFEAFWREYAARVAAPARFTVPWRAGAPLATPAGIGNAAAALEALDSAARRVERTFGALDVKWGAVHRLRRDTVNLPASGGPGTLGVFRVLDYETNAKGDTLTASGGDSFVAAIEFSRPVRARALLGYGNASQPGSPHRVDQLPLLARQELRPVWRTKEEVLKNLEAREWF